MWPYWFMFLVPALLAIQAARHRVAIRTGMRSLAVPVSWLLAGLVTAVLVGWRYEVGGDWTTYIKIFRDTTRWDLATALEFGDPGYQLLNWYAADLGLSIYSVNFVSGLIFAAGLVVFCRSLPRPWLALAVAVPYLVIVVAMGYTRQSVALGLAMLGLVALGRRRLRYFILFTVLAATFHKSAVLLLPIAALAATRNRLAAALWVGVITAGAYYLLLEDAAESLYTNYVLAGYESQGALIRLVMNALPAVILIVFHRRFEFVRSEQRLWMWFSIISLVLLAVYFVSPSSTAVDRVALYMLPLQLVVFSHLPDVLGRRGGRNDAVVAGVVVYYAAVLFVWLNYAGHAFAWVPYQFYPLVAD
jgi:hypothetical protein